MYASGYGERQMDYSMQNDALSLEYKLNEGRARRQVDVADFVNDALRQRETSVLGLGLEEELLDLGRRQLRAVGENVPNF